MNFFIINLLKIAQHQSFAYVVDEKEPHTRFTETVLSERVYSNVSESNVEVNAPASALDEFFTSVVITTELFA